MIVLDTNVISEVMSLAPSPAVLAWLRAVPIFDLGTTTISIAEIRYGVARLPIGRRRSELEARFQQLSCPHFSTIAFSALTFSLPTLTAKSSRRGNAMAVPWWGWMR
jgi:hypothetical protein